MNFSGIKSKTVINQTEKLLKDKQQFNSLCVSRTINSVGIIVDEGSKFDFESLKKLQKEISSDSKNFHILTCKSSGESYNEFRGLLFFEKDFSWNGKIKSTELLNFLANDFDMLIDYTKSNTIFKKLLVAKSKAKFKVGYASVDERLYDFMIAVENESIPQFNNELVKYLKILRKI